MVSTPGETHRACSSVRGLAWLGYGSPGVRLRVHGQSWMLWSGCITVNKYWLYTYIYIHIITNMYIYICRCRYINIGYIGYKPGMNTFSLQAILALYWLMGCNIRCTKDVLKFPFGWFPKLGFPTWVGSIKGIYIDRSVFPSSKQIAMEHLTIFHW